MSAPKARLLGVAIAAWVVVTAAAFASLWRYSLTPGEAGAAPLSITSSSKSFELLMFLHPECNCSRASVAELSRLLAEAQRPVNVRVYFDVPKGSDSSWRLSALYDLIARLPGVSIEEDLGGEMADKFGARTSGHVLLYSPDGRLAFSGGITSARAHEGDNAGESAVLAILAGDGDALRSTNVYGCGLNNPATPTTSLTSTKAVP